MSIQRSRIVALALLAACGRADESRPAGPSLAATPAPGVVAPSPATPAELLLSSGDSAIDLAASPYVPAVGILVRGADGRTRVVRWTAGATQSSPVVDLPSGFQARGIASHPAKATYFVSGTIAGKSQILSIDNSKTSVVFETPREIGRLIVGPRPFEGDSGVSYRLFFETKLAKGGSSLRSVTERGNVEYQIVGPSSEIVAYPEEHNPGGIDAPFGTPTGFHPRGQPLFWQDQRGCTHAFAYSSGWTGDKPVSEIPCGGATSLTPNGNAYVHWRKGQPGITLIGKGITTPAQAATFTFLTPPVPVPDGRGVIGIVSKGASRIAIEYVPLEIPLADVANAWQHPVTACEMELFAREGGSFRDSDGGQLFQVYEHFNYGAGASVPFLATTDLFWDNFGAAFNGVFIVSEKERAIGAFWTFVDSANSVLARTAPGTKWSKAFAAIADSRKPNAMGEAGLIARETGKKMSVVVDSVFDFAELMPRGHYTSTPQMKHYFRAVHYLTEISKSIDEKAAAPLVALPASVHQAAWRWIDVYRPFIASPRSALVWTGGTMPPIAPYSKHPAAQRRMFPLSWGLDNEVLESTVFHSAWPVDEQVDRMHPSGVDVALVYGNGFARSLLANDLKAIANFDRVTAGITARRPRIAAGSSVYDRWLDALGAEWADSIRFPGVPANSKLWDVKRLQTGLASWATLREATILVNERAGAAEAGEGGFEELVPEQPRGYVEPAPKTFEAIAQLFESLSRTVAATSEMEVSLRTGIVSRLDSSAAQVRRFGAMAEREVRGQPLSESDYEAIRSVAGIAEHDFLVYKSIATKDEGIPKPDPMPKIADVAGDLRDGVLEVAVGNPLEWRQIVPYFGRREIVIGGVYSYHEFVSQKLYDNESWRREVGQHPHPAWVQPMIASAASACSDTGAR